MKRVTIFLSLLSLAVFSGWSQENMVTISGGYAFANMEGTDTNPSGYRINGLFEFNPLEGMLSHGISFGYIGTKAESEGTQGAAYNLNNWPIYYAPKVIFGKGKFKFYVKGALGLHISTYERIGALIDTKDTDVGFYGGAGLGAMIFIGELIFLNVEYELAYLSNTDYTNGVMNTANLGLGFKF